MILLIALERKTFNFLKQDCKKLYFFVLYNGLHQVRRDGLMSHI